jgi:hypothetical protein
VATTSNRDPEASRRIRVDAIGVEHCCCEAGDRDFGDSIAQLLRKNAVQRSVIKSATNVAAQVASEQRSRGACLPEDCLVGKIEKARANFGHIDDLDCPGVGACPVLCILQWDIDFEGPIKFFVDLVADISAATR